MSEPKPNTGHEASDVSIRGIAQFLIWLTVGTIVICGALILLFGALSARRESAPHPLADSRELPPAPRLQVTPTVDLERLRARGHETLSSYGWVDRSAGVVRIPIERAMDLIAERGLPTRTADPRQPAPEVKRR